MTRTHVPVLAGELIELLDPHAGETAIDCTFGDGGHARLVAGRIGPAGVLVCGDRGPAAGGGVGGLARGGGGGTPLMGMGDAGARAGAVGEGDRGGTGAPARRVRLV